MTPVAGSGWFVSGILNAFLLVFVGLFPIVNPIESAPFFYSMTASLTTLERKAMARRVAINGFGLLLGSMVLGPYVLEFFGIQLAVVRIAGGLVVTSLGWNSCSMSTRRSMPWIRRRRRRFAAKSGHSFRLRSLIMILA